jgi:hypothetical protein
VTLGEVYLKRAVVGDGRGRVLGVDRRLLRDRGRPIERESPAREPHLEALVEVAEPVDPDFDLTVEKADLDILASDAGRVEDDQVRVVAL